jgi:hypothetical protein
VVKGSSPGYSACCKSIDLHLIISIGSGNPSEGENFTPAYTAAQVYIHSQQEIQASLAASSSYRQAWSRCGTGPGDGPALNLEPLTATFVAGIARPPQVRRSVRERPG